MGFCYHGNYFITIGIGEINFGKFKYSWTRKFFGTNLLVFHRKILHEYFSSFFFPKCFVFCKHVRLFVCSKVLSLLFWPSFGAHIKSQNGSQNGFLLTFFLKSLFFEDNTFTFFWLRRNLQIDGLKQKNSVK